ncbi:GumC family protein [Flavitalea sp.]|nr:polysaccharide biosynthesis tyrosine autokinase [Flavitalea sp.]
MRNISETGDESIGNIISQFFNRYIPYWPIFLILLVISLTGTWLYTRLTAPLYESVATLLIKDEKKGIDDSRMIESLNLITTKKIVENEIEVLTSRSLMNEVVTDLKLYAPVYSVNNWGKVSAYSFSPIQIEAKYPKLLPEVAKIRIKYNSMKSEAMIDNRSFPLNEWVQTSYGILKFIQTKTNQAWEEKPLYFALTNPKKVTSDLMEKFEVSASSKLSTVLNLKLKNEDPVLAEHILNHLIKAYNRAAINDKNALAASTFQFVQQRLNIVGRHLDSIEDKIQKYKSNKGAVDISSQGQLFLKNVSLNDQKVSDINMQLAVLDQVERYVKTKDNSFGIVPSTLGISDPLLTGLLEKLYISELEKERLKKTTGENSPVMISLFNQIEKIKPSIIENIQGQRRSLEASLKNLLFTNTTYSSLLQSIPQKERDLVEISRQQQIESSIYSFLLQKKEEAALSNSSTVADNRIVDQAESSLFPVSPNKKLIYPLAVMVAFAFGILLINSKEYLSNNILFRNEIETMSSFPIIAEICYENSKNPIVIYDGARGIIAEQFRKLRTSLRHIGIGGKQKILLVTSSVPGDGKSFVAANLGLSVALTGKKVVIVEADLSNPSLSQILTVATEKGLSSYLKDELELEDIIVRTEININLFVVAAGALPSNPSELLMKDRMADLLVYLEQVFDLVLIDTAPVGLLSDAYTLAQHCDATLYIIRHGHTPKIAVERLDKNNQIHELKNVGLVFNGIRSRGFKKYSYGHAYGYGYDTNTNHYQSKLATK